MPPSAPLLVLETVSKVRTLRDEDDPVRVVAAARALLNDNTPLPDEVSAAVYQIYADALVQSSQFERLLELVQEQDKNKNNSSSVLVPAHVYALYRLERYAQAQELAQQQQQGNDENASFWQHVIAQCHYRSGNIAQAEQAYQTLLENNDDAQVATNWVATLLANATPFVNADESSQLTRLQALLKVSDDSSTDYAYDLRYNIATYHALTGDVAAARQSLQRALTEAQTATADWTVDQQQRELAPLQMNLDWVRVFWQGGAVDASSLLPSMKALAASGKLVALTNRALDMAKPTDGLRLLPTTAAKFTPLQGRLLIYNRAILQYKAALWDECMETCRLLMQQSSSGGNQKHTSLPPHTNKMESLWWQARATVLLVRAQVGKGSKSHNNKNATTPEQTLDLLLTNLQKQPASALRDHAVGHVQCHRADILQLISTPQERIAFLQSLPASWQSQPAVVATLAALYQQEDQADKATQLVKETGHQDALADLLLSQGRYDQAVALYKAADLTDPVAQARYARALTYSSDPTQAIEYWNQVRPSDVLDGDDDAVVDGAELETRPVPRLRTSPRRQATAATTDVTPTMTDNNPKKKSHESVLRRRARQREAYLAELDRRGLRRTAHPDPERWLPKYERSYNRRRRNKQQPHKGAQGGVSDKDAAQLDVAARQAARASGEAASSTSTAHIAAVSSGGPRKGGRRR